MGSNSKELLGKFLDSVWGTGNKPRKVYVAYKPNPSEFDVPPGQSWPANRDSVIEFIMGMSARRQTPYYNPAMFKPEAYSNEKVNVLASWVLWCDFDGNADDARVRLKATPELPAPSWEVQSGLSGHEHWYWVLDAPAAPERFEELNRKLAYYLDADIGCWNMNRVMRPSYTTNYMDARKYSGLNLEPQPVEFLKKNDNRYPIAKFDFLPDVKSSIVENVSELGNIPPIIDIFAKYTWDADNLDLFKNPPDKDRSGAMIRLAYFGAEKGMSDEEIYAVIYDVDERVGKFRDRPNRSRLLAQMISKVRIKHPFGSSPVLHQTDESIKLVYTANELLESQFQIEWLVDDLIV